MTDSETTRADAIAKAAQRLVDLLPDAWIGGEGRVAAVDAKRALVRALMRYEFRSRPAGLGSWSYWQPAAEPSPCLADLLLTDQIEAVRILQVDGLECEYRIKR